MIKKSFLESFKGLTKREAIVRAKGSGYSYQFGNVNVMRNLRDHGNIVILLDDYDCVDHCVVGELSIIDEDL